MYNLLLWIANLPPLLIYLFYFFFLLVYSSSLNIMNINLLSSMYVERIFFHSFTVVCGIFHYVEIVIIAYLLCSLVSRTVILSLLLSGFVSCAERIYLLVHFFCCNFVFDLNPFVIFFFWGMVPDRKPNFLKLNYCSQHCFYVIIHP
jgi:hypothetical protein